MITFKEILWIKVLESWIRYQLIKNHWSYVYKLEYKLEYGAALANWMMSDVIMNLVMLGYALKDMTTSFTLENQDDH